jgi:hypothetical protein
MKQEEQLREQNIPPVVSDPDKEAGTEDDLIVPDEEDFEDVPLVDDEGEFEDEEAEVAFDDEPLDDDDNDAPEADPDAR